jgi:glutamate/tyrosine decarboxylase-like PLP-dependent enzyme
MEFDKQSAIDQFKAKTPEEKRKSIARLARALDMPDLIPIEEMTKEEVHDSLVRQGFTPADFDRMHKSVRDLLEKYRPLTEKKIEEMEG